MGPFPLQNNLRRLKPSIGKGFSGVAVVLYFLFDQFRNRFEVLFDKPEVWVAVGLGLAVFLYIALDLFIRQIYYNESGLGIVMRFGGRETWFSFLELKDVNLRKRKSMMGRQRQSRLVVEFQTGIVKFRTGLYDSKGVEELTAILVGQQARMQLGPEAILGTPSGDTARTKPQKAPTGPPSYPRGPEPIKGPNYPDHSSKRQQTRSLKKQLEEWNQNQGGSSTQKKK